MYSYSEGCATIKPTHPFDPKKDAEILKKSMKGLGTDEKAIIGILPKRSNIQRREIAIEFKAMYGKDLIKEMKSELSGKFEVLILTLMTPLAEYDAQILHKAFKGVGTNEGLLIEILCTRTNHQIEAIKEAYKKLYGKDLEKEISKETSGRFRRLMISLCQARRDNSLTVDSNRAAQDAQRLFKAGEGRVGTDETVFNEILASQSYCQLREVFEEYVRITGKDIETAIKRELSGNLQKGFLTIAKCVKNKPGYFAEKLYHSMKGMGTNDKTLIQIIVSRSELDLMDIKVAFEISYGQTLEKFVADDTSGDYRRALLSILAGNN